MGGAGLAAALEPDGGGGDALPFLRSALASRAFAETHLPNALPWFAFVPNDCRNTAAVIFVRSAAHARAGFIPERPLAEELRAFSETQLPKAFLCFLPVP